MTTDSNKPHFVLIGLRGCGKSTLGKQLSDALGRPFLDLDDFVSERMKMDGPGAIIEQHGIKRFRTEETSALEAALAFSPAVLALGGGTPTAPGAVDLLIDNRSCVIYLRATPDTLAHRLASDDNRDRPALIGDDPISEIEELFQQRDALYLNIAEAVVHVDGLSPNEALKALMLLVGPNADQDPASA